MAEYKLEELIPVLKEQIVEQLNLKHIKAEEIGDEQPLFVEGLALDSIDALELIVLLQQKYHLKLANPAEGPTIFKTVKSMAEYIIAHKK